MSRTPATKLLTVSACLAQCALFLGGTTAHAQLPAVGTTEGYEASEYYKQDFTKLKWRIKGEKAQPQGDERYLLSGVNLETFTVAGRPELAVAAPECVYDGAKRSASSPGKLKVQVSDGRFVIEGDGFLWRQTDGTNFMLTISNNIQSIVHRPTTNAATTTPMSITSRQFEFDSAKTRGTFRDDVHAEDPDIKLTCATLTAIASPNTNTFDTLISETGVTVLSKKDGRSANAERAVYTRTNETMALTGKVHWKDASQEGHAVRATIHWLENKFAADENVTVKLTRESLGLGGLLRGNTNAPTKVAGTTTPIDLFADHLQASTNLTTITGSVRIKDTTNHLSCDKLVIQSDGGERTATAEGHVVVCQGDGDDCLRADRAVYTKSVGAVVFTGQPKWKSAQSEGSANRVMLQDTGEIFAAGDVAAKVTLAGRSNAFLNFFPNSADTNHGPQVIEAFARELKANKRQISLLGNARIHQSPITGSEPHLQCETVDLFFSTNAQQHIELMEAKQNVRFEQGTIGVTNGPNSHRLLNASKLTATWNTNGTLANLVADGGVRAEQAGSVATGQRANYISTTGDLELTGQPMQLDTPDATISGAEKIVWNEKTSAFSAISYKKLTLKAEALKRRTETTAPAPK